MRTRDLDYIESRLLSGSPATEACDRLREVGHPDLAEQVMEAAQEFQDKLREVRREFVDRYRRELTKT